MADKQTIVDGVDVSKCEAYSKYREGYCDWYTPCKGDSCSYKLDWVLNQLKRKEQECEELEKQLQGAKGLITSAGKMNYQLLQEYDKLKAENDELKKKFNIYTCGICGNKEDCNKLYKTLAEIKEIAKPYQRDVDKICGYCRKYDSCHACCIDDLKFYEYRTGITKACERFVELERFNINIVANKILQKISECEVKNDRFT